jgi:propionate CoA-transferase
MRPARPPLDRSSPLFEIAPGIDLQRDVLDQMAFAPRVAANLATLSAGYFLAQEA